jgi:fructose-bisphosphate aldolase, class II
MLFSNLSDLRPSLATKLGVHGDAVTVEDRAALPALVDRLAYNAALSQGEVRDACRWLIRSLGHAVGAVPSSIQGLYQQMGRKEVAGFTVPAINIRGMTYDVARAVFRAALAHDAGAFVFEIARSEIGYTEQRPAEYAAVCLAAAVREGYRGAVFLQGDHFQFNPKKHKADPAAETGAIKDLTTEAIAAGFYNIDIDSSTLVDLGFGTLAEQQRVNFERCAELTAHVRALQPAGVVVSVGGEIGEVGKKNSTVDELRAFMGGYLAAISARGVAPGISKISVQTGTSHGGVPLPDGSVAAVKLDFDCLEALSHAARDEFGMSGAVQHGASTLPEEAFDHFPRRGASEIHLATGFQNLFYEHPRLPADLKARIYDHLARTCADERNGGETDEQFFYKTRKKAFGPFKREIWELAPAIRAAIGGDLEARVGLLMRKLGVVGTRAIVDRCVQPVPVSPGPAPGGLV